MHFFQNAIGSSQDVESFGHSCFAFQAELQGAQPVILHSCRMEGFSAFDLTIWSQQKTSCDWKRTLEGCEVYT